MKRILFLCMLAGSMAHGADYQAPIAVQETIESTENKDFLSSIIMRTRSAGKTSGTAIMSVITGGLMTGALRLVKDFDGMSGPFTYALLAGALLASLYDMVGRSAGPEYSGAACWGALASTITAGLLLQAALD